MSSSSEERDAPSPPIYSYELLRAELERRGQRFLPHPHWTYTRRMNERQMENEEHWCLTLDGRTILRVIAAWVEMAVYTSHPDHEFKRQGWFMRQLREMRQAVHAGENRGFARFLASSDEE